MSDFFTRTALTVNGEKEKTYSFPNLSISSA